LCKNTSGKQWVTAMLGSLYKRNGHISKALQLFRQSKEEALKRNDDLGVLNSLLNTFEVSFRYYWLTSLANALHGALNICETLLFVYMALKAQNRVDVPVPFVDSLLKHMDTTTAE
jgi:hypothetical protein